MSSHEAVFRPNPDVVFTRLDDREAVLLHLKSNRFYSLNETGARIWELLKSGADTAAVCAGLIEEYDVGPADARKMVGEFLNELHKEGIVQLRET